MRYRALDVNQDFSLGLGSQEYLANSPACVAQAVLTALLLHQGEWFLDTTAGMPWETQVEGFNTASLYDAAIKNAILGVEGVQSIVEYFSRLNTSSRLLTVNAIIDTIYGQTNVVASLQNS